MTLVSTGPKVHNMKDGSAALRRVSMLCIHSGSTQYASMSRSDVSEYIAHHYHSEECAGSAMSRHLASSDVDIAVEHALAKFFGKWVVPRAFNWNN